MTYTYECLKCEKQFEIEKGINEEVEVKCKKCGNINVKRIFTPIGTVVNCSGFFGKSK